MPYGHPNTSERDLRTVTLDLPRAVESVSDPDGENPPVEAYGPLTDGEDPQSQDPVVPADVDIADSVVEFTFDPPLGYGHHYIAVYQDQINAADGEPFDLLDEDGLPWSGWEVDVLRPSERKKARPGEPTRPDPRPPEPSLSVLIDGEPASQVEISGEVLTVCGPDPAEVELSVRPVLGGRGETLYEKNLGRVEHEIDGQPAVSYGSAGLVGDHKWAAYHPRTTLGRVPKDGRDLLIGTPVVRHATPLGTDPLVERNGPTTVSPEGHPNTYERTRFQVTPQSKSAPISAYQTAPTISPQVINDASNTPETNPRLFGDIAGYREEVPGPAEDVAVFDFPLQSVVEIRIGGRLAWSGQTRLVPSVVTPRHLEMELGVDLPGPKATKDAVRRVWKASMEAMKLWSKGVPDNQMPTQSMEEYVLTRIATGGVDREDGTQGEVETTFGDQETKMQSDRAGERRLARLGELLKEGEAQVPLSPEEHVPGASASIGTSSRSEPTYSGQKNAMRKVAPIYDPERNFQPSPYKTANHWVNL